MADLEPQLTLKKAELGPGGVWVASSFQSTTEQSLWTAGNVA